MGYQLSWGTNFREVPIFVDFVDMFYDEFEATTKYNMENEKHEWKDPRKCRFTKRHEILGPRK